MFVAEETQQRERLVNRFRFQDASRACASLERLLMIISPGRDALREIGAGLADFPSSRTIRHCFSRARARLNNDDDAAGAFIKLPQRPTYSFNAAA